MLFVFRSFLRDRRLRRRARALIDIEFTSSEAGQIAVAVDGFVDASKDLVDAVKDADGWSIRVALQNLLTQADFAKDLAQRIEDRIPPEWRRLQRTMPPSAEPANTTGGHLPTVVRVRPPKSGKGPRDRGPLSNVNRSTSPI